MKKWKIGLLARVAIAIILGILSGLFFPTWALRIFLTFNGLFSNFLDFIVPLIIVGLIAPGIAELGKGAGKMLGTTMALAYGSTVLTGFFTLLACKLVYPILLDGAETAMTMASPAENGLSAGEQLVPYFTLDFSPLFGVMPALVLAFVLGLGLTIINNGDVLKQALLGFREIVNKTISGVIIPLLPLFIFGIFMKMAAEGHVVQVMGVFVKIVILIFILTVILLVFQFSVAGLVARRNPFTMLRTMLTAYVTALGTQSSAATIPVTLRQTISLGIDPRIAGSVIPLCATVHLSGSMLKITACALAVMIMMNIPVDPAVFVGFIFLLAITMIAAPGVPGGAIMAAIGVLQSVLGFDPEATGLMISLYIAMDSFGTACNVTGDGAIAVIVDKMYA
ncbi:MAG TPA: dicarboxylate/amino acid:cation symporter [Bacteroidales bacterium]|jgi:Na+/H+-dicarboxylate symporter|nr:dicarboxylate/amino acid:cation symporter [Bacteroidales bacterium]MCZ2418016.1 dicarboxylate/amino acid:cation symporter [Burkholderiales bacterium]OQC58199.1 MAG: Serine/threonine transporter SstT [Bacteroidetes bacterium ADurb.Bin013]MBP8999682.1 dicarboxylate/amino acid:cation symporter [Bacteroidales bacterium]MBV6455968.1 Serine/threonine transporter SstT [Bacteroidales bacterium]